MCWLVCWRSRAGRKERIKTNGDRIASSGWFTRFAVLIVDLDELDLGELFEVLDKRLGNGIERAVRLTTAGEVDVCNTIGKGKFAVTSKAIKHKCETFVAFDIAGTFEEFI